MNEPYPSFACDPKKLARAAEIRIKPMPKSRKRCLRIVRRRVKKFFSFMRNLTPPTMSMRVEKFNGLDVMITECERDIRVSLMYGAIIKDMSNKAMLTLIHS